MENDSVVFPAGTLSSSAYYCIATVYALQALSGFLLNSLVLFTFLADRSLLTASNYFIFSIAVADWLMATVANPLGVVTNVRVATNVTQANGQTNCKIYAWITTLLGLGTMLQHSAIAVEKCRTLCLPMIANPSPTRIKAVISLLWCFALMWSTFPLLGWSAYVPEGANTVCSIRWHSPSSFSNTSYVACIFVFFFFAPVLVIIISYVITYSNVRRMVRQAEITWGANAMATSATIAKSVSLAKISATMVSGFIVAWTPYAVVSLYAASAGPEEIPAVATILPAIFAKNASLYNPLIYFFAYKKFRESLWKLWRKFRGRNVIRDVERHVRFSKNEAAETN